MSAEAKQWRPGAGLRTGSRQSSTLQTPSPSARERSSQVGHSLCLHRCMVSVVVRLVHLPGAMLDVLWSLYSLQGLANY